MEALFLDCGARRPQLKRNPLGGGKGESGAMAFPDIHKHPQGDPGPYEHQMGRRIAELVRLFSSGVPDSESNARVLELAVTPRRWSAGHDVFDEVRRRLLAAQKAKDGLRERQHYFEESCCQAMYNATNPQDPFDSGSAFFVAGEALGLARAIGTPIEAVVAVLEPNP